MRLQSLKTALRAFYSILLGIVCTINLNVASAQSGNFEKADTSRVSIGTFSGATDANAANGNSQISRNGRFVVFESTATNLVNYVTVTAGRKHIYLLDRQAGTLELVSINLSGTEAAGDSFTPSVSADGRYVSFTTGASYDGGRTYGINTIWRKDTETGEDQLLAPDEDCLVNNC